MSIFKRFEEIILWQKARERNKIVGKRIDDKRFAHNFRPINQIEGSAGSILDNILNCLESGSTRKCMQFLHLSKGSRGELRSQLYRALDSYICRRNWISYVGTQLIKPLIQKLVTHLENAISRGLTCKQRHQQTSEIS